MVVFMALIYYRQTYQAPPAKGKGTWAESGRGGHQVQASEGPLPVDSHRTRLVPPLSVTRHLNCCQSKIIRDSVLRVFNGGWSYKHLLPRTYPSHSVTEGKQVFSINYIVCTNNLSTLNHGYQFWRWQEPSRN